MILPKSLTTNFCQTSTQTEKQRQNSDLKFDVTWYGALYMIISLPSRMSNMKVVSWQPCLLHELKS
ncbi:hypothetical protein GAGA_3156 [Paraglaciecola agarilytica NO2]|uniref:Uncharacterized protein n=1 Tax=Paraglaciecola agarilytica NO2 TaxID=1125747 RepID=A0ABQ0I9D7_9ALTE|nr:hypothetical protein GAGA_3156 [Paraglaciecola agarilytica NO2]